MAEGEWACGAVADSSLGSLANERLLGATIMEEMTCGLNEITARVRLNKGKVGASQGRRGKWQSKRRFVTLQTMQEAPALWGSWKAAPGASGSFESHCAFPLTQPLKTDSSAPDRGKTKAGSRPSPSQMRLRGNQNTLAYRLLTYISIPVRLTRNSQVASPEP